jgi:hypothetical protein
MVVTRIPANEHLFIDSYFELCEGLPLYYLSTEDVYDFFRRCERGEVGPCVLVSAGCDFSIREQDVHHPNADLYAHAMSLDYQEMARERSGYQAARIGPTADPKKCCPTDKYIARTDRYGWFTLNDVPANILCWYTTNLDVRHPRIRWLPFGLNNDGPGAHMLPQFVGKPKRGLLYVNFQLTSFERVHLYRHFSKQPWVTFRDQANLPVEQYLAEMAEHEFVLSPFGCGIDCYRNWEAIYLGTVPVVPKSTFSDYLADAGLPVAQLENRAFYRATKDDFAGVYDPELFSPAFLGHATRSFWRAEFEKSAQLLTS